MPDPDQTIPKPPAFDFQAFPEDTLFFERREGQERRGGEVEAKAPDAGAPRAPSERRAKKERRRRIDPTTFEKQYTDDELEFMNAMQRFKVQSGKAFPSHADVIRVAVSLGYRLRVADDDGSDEAPEAVDFEEVLEPPIHVNVASPSLAVEL